MTFVDDKSPIVVPFLLERLAVFQKEQHQTKNPKRPFLVGINGVQGVGKTTLVTTLADTLQNQKHLETLVVSIDDFYLAHADQCALAAAHPDNRLVQVRGEPGTHDTKLLQQFFEAVVQGKPARVPEYDKAAFSGQGDRVAPTEAVPGRLVNEDPSKPLQVVILEGWCVGFRPRPREEIEALWRRSKGADAKETKLRDHALEDLLFVNDQLRHYDPVSDLLDAFVHLDAEHTPYVYDWRREQEAALRRDRGVGMTDEQVVRFVDAYYPAYELFADGVRSGVFGHEAHAKGRQLRLIVGRDRRVKETIVL